MAESQNAFVIHNTQFHRVLAPLQLVMSAQTRFLICSEEQQVKV